MIDPLTMRKNWSILAFIASRSAFAWVDFKVSAIRGKWRTFPIIPVPAQIDQTVEWLQQKMQWTMQQRLLRPGAGPAQGGSWWVGGVPGSLVQRGRPWFWGTLTQGAGLRKGLRAEQQTIEILQRTKDEESTQQWGYYQENCSRDRSQLSEMEGREGRLHYSGGRNPSAEKQLPCSNQWGRNISGTFPMPTMCESTLIWDIGKNGRMNVWKAGYKDEQKHI